MKKNIDSSTVLEYLQGVPWWQRQWNRLVRWWQGPPARPSVPPTPIPGAVSKPRPIPGEFIKPRSDPPRVPSGEVQSVEEVLREDARLRRRFGPVHVENAPPSKQTEPVNIWQLDRKANDPKTGPICIVRNDVSSAYALVLQSPQGWLFWTGPKQKLFTRLGESELWTSTDRTAVLVIATFLYSSGAAHAKKSRSVKR